MAQPDQPNKQPVGGFGGDISPDTAEALQRLQAEVQSLQDRLERVESEKDAVVEQVQQTDQNVTEAKKAQVETLQKQDDQNSVNTQIQTAQEELKETTENIHKFTVYNASGETIPAHSPCKISSKSSDQSVYNVVKPDAEDLPPAQLLFIGEADVGSGNNGIAYSALDNLVWISMDAAPAVGDTIGTQAGAWTMKVGDQGGLTALSATNPTIARQNGGGALETMFLQAQADMTADDTFYSVVRLNTDGTTGASAEAKRPNGISVSNGDKGVLSIDSGGDYVFIPVYAENTSDDENNLPNGTYNKDFLVWNDTDSVWENAGAYYFDSAKVQVLVNNQGAIYWMELTEFICP